VALPLPLPNLLVLLRSWVCFAFFQVLFFMVFADLVLGSSVGEPSKELMQYDLEPGELAPEGESFVPWAALKKYPYLYIGVANKQKVCSGSCRYCSDWANRK
jgi:hypothetical protein